MSRSRIILLVANMILAASSLRTIKKETPSIHNNVSQENSLGIVGGSNTTIQKHPYQCSVLYYSEFFCSCAILNKNWVLTLGDCIYGAFPDEYLIRVGSDSSSDGGSLYGVQALTIHPGYNVSTRSYDYGLMKLSKPLTFSNKINKVKLPTSNLKTGQKAVISGWGSTSNENAFQDLTVKGVDYEDCQEIYDVWNYTVTKTMLCASAKGAGPCYNDFGDPLVNNNKLFGLFTWVFNCGDDNYPGVYTSIPAGVDWIKSNIKN